MNILIYSCIAIGVCLFILKNQVESAENFCMAQYESERDPLTHLLNRGEGERRVRQLINHNTHGAFVLIDIDDFKQINDQLALATAFIKEKRLSLKPYIIPVIRHYI